MRRNSEEAYAAFSSPRLSSLFLHRGQGGLVSLFSLGTVFSLMGFWMRQFVFALNPSPNKEQPGILLSAQPRPSLGGELRRTRLNEGKQERERREEGGRKGEGAS